MLKKEEVIREYCRIAALVYHSIGDYTNPNDGFCDLCPHSSNPTSFRSSPGVIDWIREAVVARLKSEGIIIAEGFDPETGKEL